MWLPLHILFLCWVAGASALPQQGDLQNVFSYPIGGLVETTAPAIIQWIPSTEGPVSITLLSNGVSVAQIAKSAPNTGSFTWTVPSSVPSRSNYTLQLTWPSSTSTSPSFTINNPRSQTTLQTLTTPAPTPAPSSNATSSSKTTTTRQPTITDTILLLDPSPAPAQATNPNEIIPVERGPSGQGVTMPGMIAGATVGACVGAALLLAGVLVLMRRRGRRLEYLQQEKERRSAIDAYGRTGGMVNGF